MRNKLEKLEKENVELRAQLQSMQSAFAELQLENAELKRRNQYLLLQMYGRTSEKMDSRQMELLLGLPVIEEAADIEETLLLHCRQGTVHAGNASPASRSICRWRISLLNLRK